MAKLKLLTAGAIGALGAAALLAGTAQAADIEFFGQGKLQPTYIDNTDFDSDSPDRAVLTDAGLVDVGAPHIRAEIRLGAKAAGDDWSAFLMLENDYVLDARSADRALFSGGAKFGIERAFFTYSLDPMLVLEAGIKTQGFDLDSGALFFSEPDYPFVGFMGEAYWGGYEVLYVPVINNQNGFGGLDPFGSAHDGDWTVYLGRLDFNLAGGGTLRPFLAFGDNDQKNNQATWFGAQYTNHFGLINFAAEVVGVAGEFDGDAPAGFANDDILSGAAYAGLELELSHAFQPYVAVRWAQGDDDPFDDNVEGWNGVSDYGRASPLMGLGGQLLGWGLNGTRAFSSPNFGLSLATSGPDRGFQGGYGARNNTGNGLNPGQLILATGATGNLAAISPNLSYKGQVFFIWYAATGSLEALPNASDDVDKYAATEIDLQLKYEFNRHFSARLVGSTILPGAGIEDATGGNDDPASLVMLGLLWRY